MLLNSDASTAGMENLKNGFETLSKDFNAIRMSTFFIFKNLRKLRGKTLRKLANEIPKSNSTAYMRRGM